MDELLTSPFLMNDYSSNYNNAAILVSSYANKGSKYHQLLYCVFA